LTNSTLTYSPSDRSLFFVRARSDPPEPKPPRLLFTKAHLEYDGELHMDRGTIFNKQLKYFPMDDEVKNALVQGAEAYPIPEGKIFEYGTAGVSSESSSASTAADLMSVVPNGCVSNLCLWRRTPD
jgi:hypothetical protein